MLLANTLHFVWGRGTESLGKKMLERWSLNTELQKFLLFNSIHLHEHGSLRLHNPEIS